MEQYRNVDRGRAPCPIISIVIATYNASETLDEAIQSFVNQNREDCELIVIDGNSTDETLSVISRYKNSIAYWVSEEDTGIYNAWNKGLAVASGRYIGFLGADDILLPRALEIYLAAISANSEAEYISSRVRYGEGPSARLIGRPWSWSRIRHSITIAHVGSMHRRSLFDRIGGFDERFAIAGDYELLLRAGPELRAAFVPAITVQMGTGGISSGRTAQVFVETSLAKRLHSGLPAWVIQKDHYRAVFGSRLRGLLKM